jgi:hypothetical protein
MRASPGDSGSAVFNADNQLVCAPVCCVSNDGSLFGGGPFAIRQLLERFAAPVSSFVSDCSGFRELTPVLIDEFHSPMNWIF